jgi:hypothetical protein
MATALGNTSIATEYVQWRDFAQKASLSLWNPAMKSFAVRPLPRPAGQTPPAVFVQNSKECNLTAVRKMNELVGVRELLAFIPWYFSDGANPLIPYDLADDYMLMWEQLFDHNGFRGEWGLTTAERRHPCYNYTWDKACGAVTSKGGGNQCGNTFHGVGNANRNTWNANSWPYETSRVLTGMANILHNVNTTDEAPPVTAARYWTLLLQYAQQHTKSYAVDDTANPHGSGHICENIHPDLGYWNTRQWRYISNQPASAVNKGSDYFHSSFNDLIISGLLGFRADRADNGDLLLSASPLFSSSAESSTDVVGFIPPFFAVDGIRAAAHDITLIWDVDGTRYNRGNGLTLIVDDKVAVTRETLGRLHVRLPAAAPTGV